jgi:hypothetical protein
MKTISCGKRVSLCTNSAARENFFAISYRIEDLISSIYFRLYSMEHIIQRLNWTQVDNRPNSGLTDLKDKNSAIAPLPPSSKHVLQTNASSHISTYLLTQSLFMCLQLYIRIRNLNKYLPIPWKRHIEERTQLPQIPFGSKPSSFIARLSVVFGVIYYLSGSPSPYL